MNEQTAQALIGCAAITAMGLILAMRMKDSSDMVKAARDVGASARILVQTFSDSS